MTSRFLARAVLFASLFVLPTLYAELAPPIQRQHAMTAYSLVTKVKYLYRFCQTCGDIAPQKTAIRTIG